MDHAAAKAVAFLLGALVATAIALALAHGARSLEMLRSRVSGFRVLGFGVSGLGFRVQGFGVSGLGFRVQGFGVSDLGAGLGLRNRAHGSTRSPKDSKPY